MASELAAGSAAAVQLWRLAISNAGNLLNANAKQAAYDRLLPLEQAHGDYNDVESSKHDFYVVSNVILELINPQIVISIYVIGMHSGYFGLFFHSSHNKLFFKNHLIEQYKMFLLRILVITSRI